MFLVLTTTTERSRCTMFIPEDLGKISGVPIQQIIRVEVGTFPSSEELRKAVHRKQHPVFSLCWSEIALDQIPVASERKSLDLVVLHVCDMPREYPGVNPCPPLETVIEWGESLGLEKCPKETGLQLFIQYRFGFCRIFITIISDPIINGFEKVGLFRLYPNERSNDPDDPDLGMGSLEFDEELCVFVRGCMD